MGKRLMKRFFFNLWKTQPNTVLGIGALIILIAFFKLITYSPVQEVKVEPYKPTPKVIVPETTDLNNDNKPTFQDFGNDCRRLSRQIVELNNVRILLVKKARYGDEVDRIKIGNKELIITEGYEPDQKIRQENMAKAANKYSLTDRINQLLELSKEYCPK